MLKTINLTAKHLINQLQKTMPLAAIHLILGNFLFNEEREKECFAAFVAPLKWIATSNCSSLNATNASKHL